MELKHSLNTLLATRQAIGIVLDSLVCFNLEEITWSMVRILNEREWVCQRLVKLLWYS